MNEFEFNVDNSQIGYRLEYLELFNWGTFHEKVWRIEPNGNNSLLTGSIGSGKSTVVDALTSLIVPHHKITFNKAAGAENKERTLATYIKGEYKNSKSDDAETKGKAVTLRYKNENDSTFSVVLANFSNQGYSKNITLAEVFWIENDKTQKLLIISLRPLTIKEYFTDIEDVKALRKVIRNLVGIEYVGDSFSEYSQKFRHLFGMNSDKAIDLFYQTVSMKSVSSLTTFVREQMLERTEIKEQLEDLKKRFDDLNKAYIAVQEARKQRDILKPIVDLSISYSNFEREIQEIDQILESIPSYFANKKFDLLTIEIESCETKLNQLNNQLAKIESELREKRKAENQINQAIDNNGGARLKEIAAAIEQRIKDKSAKKERHGKYAKILGECNLPVANTDKTFYSNVKAAQLKIPDLIIVQENKLQEQGGLIADQRNLADEIEKEEKELTSLRNRVNQIPSKFLDIRYQIANDLEIAVDEIPFAGELMKVRDEDKKWEGALERLLSGFAVSMLVPEKHYKLISHYINARKLTDQTKRGIKLDYFSVPFSSKRTLSDEIGVDSVVNKIEIKEDSIFEYWLQNELEQHFNLQCVSLEEFQRQKRDVITIEGQIKRGKKHTKDDRRDLWDRRNFVLGWTNKEKIIAVELHLDELNNKKNEIENSLGILKSELENINTLNSNLKSLIATYTNWNDLNWQDEAIEISKLEKEKNDLETSSDVLKSLQHQLEIVGKEISDLEGTQKPKSEEIGGIRTNLNTYKENLVECKDIAGFLQEKEAIITYPKIDQLIKDEKISFKTIDDISNRLKVRFTGKGGEKDNLKDKLNSTSNKITKVMVEYKKEFPSETLDLSTELETRIEFIKIFEKIISDGLPSYETRFKEMLNKNTIEDIRVFDAKLDGHEKQIKKKIEDINKPLKEIEFNKGTYVKLLNEKNSDRTIRDFKNDLRDCYSGILEASDAYTEDRFTKVKKFLDRFMSNKSEDLEWTKKVTDVRNWFLFNASERYLVDDSEKEFYADTSGKSGGQKEKLAYTILASALVYQFGLSDGKAKSNSFRFVVIDEAFGRGDDESTQFGLGLFKKLNLQLLIVTPLQKIHVIENYINSVHYVSNIEGNNSQVQNLTITEYKKEKESYNTMNSRVEVIANNL